MSRSTEILDVAERRGTGASDFRLVPLLLIAAGARILWWCVAAHAMSLDLRGWHAVVLQIAQGRNPYVTTVRMNYPPFWFEVLFLIQRISDRSGISDIDLIRIVLIAGDLAVLGAIWRLLRMLQPQTNSSGLLIWGYCLNPLLILLTIQHGNFDALAVFWDILFLQFLIRFRRGGQVVDWFIAALCLSLAIYTKQFSAILWPLLVPGARNQPARARILCAVMVALPAALAIAPLYALNPDEITRRVLEYRSVGKTFGIVGALSLGFPLLNLNTYSFIFMILIGAASILAAFRLWKQGLRSDGDVVLVSMLTLLGLFTIGPGYGPQYWFWVLPLTVVCYREADSSYRRWITVFLVVVIATNVFEYAVEHDLGQFLGCWFGSARLAPLNNWFPYPSSRLTLLHMPMSIASLALIVRGMEGVCRRNGCTESPSRPV